MAPSGELSVIVSTALEQVLALKPPQLSLTQSTAPARISLKIRTLKAKLATITQRLDWVQVQMNSRDRLTVQQL
ncbi:MAG: hypothetical protein WDW36_003716 [Sanguina aurantia]